MYQDSFEVVNPLGSAKGKYKILAVYLSLGNLPDYVRSHIDSIQLVALCREKYFDCEKVYGTIVEDIRKIEINGLEIKGKCIRGTVAHIAGDNLGNNDLGGFCTNFSRSIFFCRYCLIERIKGIILIINDSAPQNMRQINCEIEEDDDIEDSFDTSDSNKSSDNNLDKSSDSNVSSDSSELSECDSSTEDLEEESLEDYYFFKTYRKRTVEAYQESLSHVTEGKHFQGVKFDSIFNRLQYYHVCKPGLCPCCGHDFLEGVVAVDVPIFTKYFVDLEWFTYAELNKRIENFKYSYPLLIGDKIKNFEDKVWLCLLKLSEIVEIIFAPEINKNFVAYLQVIINEYLYSRMTLFPNNKLLPKHHFISHYPKLILEFGPLLKVWTLRFESKHTFFKSCIRNLRNFKNVTFSLAEKHELHQCLVRQGSRLRHVQSVTGEIKLQPNLYCSNIRRAIFEKGLNNNDMMECSSAIIKGTNYKRGDVVVVRQEHYQFNTVFGKICLILYDCQEKVSFVLEILETTFKPHLRVYEIGSILNYECVFANDLEYYEPLHIYYTNIIPQVRLKHGLVTHI